MAAHPAHHVPLTAPLQNPGRTLLFLFLLGELTGCATTHQLVNVWKDPDYPVQPMTHVLVIAVKKDPARRRLWEDAFSRELTARGVSATSSYRLFPEALPDTQQVIQAVRDRDFDGVAVTVRLPSTTRTTYVPGYVTTLPVTVYRPWYRSYYTYYKEVYEPGYTETDRVVRHRTDVWSTQDQGRLVWTGTSEVIDPNSQQDVDREIAGMIVPDLAKQGVIPAK